MISDFCILGGSEDFSAYQPHVTGQKGQINQQTHWNKQNLTVKNIVFFQAGAEQLLVVIINKFARRDPGSTVPRARNL